MGANSTIMDSLERLPASARAVSGAPGGPLLATTLFALLLLGAYLTAEALFGELTAIAQGRAASLGLRATATLLLFVAVTPVAHLYHVRWTTRNVADLEHRFPKLPRAEIPSAPSLMAGFAGSGFFTLLFFVLPALLAGRAPGFTPQFAFAAIGGSLYGWLAARLLVCMVVDARRISRWTARIDGIDLFDPEPLAPIVRQGLSDSLILVVFICLSAHLFVAPGDRALGSAMLLFFLFSVMVVVFTLPARGAHRLIRSEKRRRLRNLREQFRALASAVEGGDAGPDDAHRLVALLALEQRLEGVREWPIDAGSWLRFGLYVLLGLGSWIGAAGVERLLDAWF